MVTPDFVIIGAQKAASSFIRDCLGEHPNVLMLPSEIPLFEYVDYKERAKNAFAPFQNNGMFVKGFKRPNIMSHPEAPERFKDLLPDAKAIVLLRDPVRRAISAYYHYMRYNFIPAVPIAEGMPKLLNGEWNSYRRADEILAFGFYYKHIVRFDQYLKAGRLKVIPWKEILSNKEKTVRDLYTFIGVDPNFVPPTTTKPHIRTRYSYKRFKLLQAANRLRFERQLDAENNLVHKNMNIIEKMGLFMLLGIDSLILSRIARSDPVNHNLLYRLHTYYRDDIEKLESLLGCDLSHWKNYPAPE